MTDRKIRKGLTRRALSRQIGLAAGVTLVGSNLAGAAMAPTPKQVEGPFHSINAQSDTDTDLCVIEGHTEPAKGEVILVRGQVTDVNGQPLEGALVFGKPIISGGTATQKIPTQRRWTRIFRVGG